MASEEKRLMWLDVIKGICMFFIVMSHSSPPEAYIRFYTPFFLAAFFFSSGYTFSGRKNLKAFLIHKAGTILIPYWCFGIINAVLAWVADGDNLLDRFLGLLLSFNRKNDDLWFVMCLFTMQIIFYVLWSAILRIETNRRTLFVAALISIILSVLGYCLIMFDIRLPFQCETALVMIPFMMAGYICKNSLIVSQFGGVQQYYV